MQNKAYQTMPIYKIAFCLLVLNTTSLIIYSQGENNIWYFSLGYGVDFNTDPPTILDDGELSARFEGVATVSDKQGNLLFYSHGVRIYDRNHQVMANSDFLGGHPRITQTVLILPSIEDINQYYVFTLGSGIGSGELYYSIVDMQLNGGLGAVVNGKKKILLHTNVTEKLVAAKGYCGEKWVVVHERENNRFISIKINDSGIQNPVISDVGQNHISRESYQGQMKFSPDYSRVAVATGTGIVEVFDFNRTTGIVSNPISLPIDTSEYGILGAYGLSFSPNNQLLYVNEGLVIPGVEIIRRLFQYNLQTGNTTTIQASKTLVGIPDFVNDYISDMQLAPNGVIYTARRNRNHLGAILNPDVVGVGCNYTNEGLFLGQFNFFNQSSLQNPVVVIEPYDSLILPLLPQDTFMCQNQSLFIELPAEDSLALWNDGSIGNTFIIENPNTYSVDIDINDCIYRDTIKVDYDSTIVNLGPDTILCPNESMVVDAMTQNASFVWQDGSTSPTYFADTIGEFWVDVSVNDCTIRDSIKIDFQSLDLDLGKDTILCEGEEFVVDAALPDSVVDYLWYDGLSSPQRVIDTSGIYWVEASANGCSKKDTIRITQNAFSIDLGTDSILCSHESLLLNASILEAGYVWQDGSNLSSFTVNEEGTYWVEVSLDNCTETDTIHISYQEIGIDLGEDMIICTGESLFLDAGVDGASYLWQDNSSFPYFDVTEAGVYWVEAVMNHCTARDTVHVSMSKLEVNFGADTMMCPGNELFLNNSIPDATYMWQDGSYGLSFLINKPGEYWVEAILDDCIVRDSLSIYESSDCGESSVYIPNIFSPNDDGENDVFQVFSNLQLRDYSLKIFNRWGGLIFQSNNQHEGWDGFFNGEILNPGVYVVKLSYSDDLSNPINDYSTLTLVK